MTKDKDSPDIEVSQVKARKNLRVGNLSEETIKALEESRMDERHVSLNKLTKGGRPG
jgi:hypothetical protein